VVDKMLSYIWYILRTDEIGGLNAAKIGNIPYHNIGIPQSRGTSKCHCFQDRKGISALLQVPYPLVLPTDQNTHRISKWKEGYQT
jgi:hypothetical protein